MAANTDWPLVHSGRPAGSSSLQTLVESEIVRAWLVSEVTASGRLAAPLFPFPPKLR